MTRSQRLVVGFATLTALAAIALPCAVVAVGVALSQPRQAVIGAPPADWPGAETVLLPSASGAPVHGWWVPASGPGGGAVVLLHGVWESRRRMVPRAEVLHRHGFAVLLVDLQAHGETPGRRITFGKLEALDAAAAVAFVQARVPGERIGIDGVSLGGAAILLGPAPLPVDAVVLESVYPDIDAALVSRLRAALGGRVGAVAIPVLAPLFTHLLPPILGVAPNELRPIDRIGQTTAPVLLLSGTADDRTPLAEARALFDAAPEPKRFVPIAGAAHVDLERFDPEAYWGAVLPFLTRRLQSRGS